MHSLKHSPQYVLAGCLALAATNVSAAHAITYTQSEYTAFASADLGAQTDGPFALNSPPATLPLIANANLSDSSNSSFAAGIANTGLLVASAQTFSLGTFASSVSGADFSSQFTGTGSQVNLTIDFSSFNNVINGTADAQLFVTLVSDGTALFDEVYGGSQSVQQSFVLGAGSSNLFDIQLISNAQALGSMSGPALGFNLASAAFTVSAVPEPNMAWLMLAGMGLVGVAARRKAVRI